MARKNANNQWYIVTTHDIVERKYHVKATSAREARRMEDDELLGAIDNCFQPSKVVSAKGFATREEAVESDEAYVEWKN